MNRVVDENGSNAFQYATTEGYLPLREQIATRYKKRFGLEVSPSDILITSGSQQALDLIGKALINKDDHVLIEKPGYLGTIQALSLYEPQFHGINLLEDGLDIQSLEAALKAYAPKLLYTVPNFQNPTGLTYSKENAKRFVNYLKQLRLILLKMTFTENFVFQEKIYLILVPTG